MKREFKLILMLSIIFLSLLGFAKKNSKDQVLNFDDELIQGDAQKPELFYLLERKQYNFKKLIRLRENFIPEMTSTVEEIEVNGSGN